MFFVMYFGLDEMMLKLKKYMMSNKILFLIKGLCFFFLRNVSKNIIINVKQKYFVFVKVKNIF